MMKNLLLFLTLFLTVFSFSSHALDYGIDRLEENEVHALLDGKNLALLAHGASRNKEGHHLIDLLYKTYTLKKIFAPEHGLRSTADDWVEDGVDGTTGLPVISLYKRGSKAPTPRDLQGIDAIVIDLQDVGLRYYTYFSSISEVMKVAGPAEVEVIILDRPNLLGGNVMEGRVLHPDLTGNFAAYYSLPTRHGMTLGEISQLINHEKKMKVKLSVVKVQGWKREYLLNKMDRPWIPPSPALPEISHVAPYAMWGALEHLNLAVGRGVTNENAFKVLGAPWITVEESKLLAHELNGLHFKGVSFTPFSWDVTRAIYMGQTAHGVKMSSMGDDIRTDEFIYKVSMTLHKVFKTRIKMEPMAIIGLGSPDMLKAIQSEVPWPVYVKEIEKDLERFSLRRAPFILY
jgi:uncharacterized protein YbbC (DUF1343 family)